MGMSVNWSHGRAQGRRGPGRQLGVKAVLFAREVIMMGGALERGLGRATGGTPVIPSKYAPASLRVDSPVP